MCWFTNSLTFFSEVRLQELTRPAEPGTWNVQYTLCLNFAPTEDAILDFPCYKDSPGAKVISIT